MFVYDGGWARGINKSIAQALTAEAAIERVRQRTRRRMAEIDDPLLQERMHDLDDLANRLLRIVSGQLGTAAQTGLPPEAILIARNLGDRKSTRLNSSHANISYAVFCLKKNNYEQFGHRT